MNIEQRVVVLEGVSVGYSGIPVTKDVNLYIGESEIVCLLGPNGAGKTSTLLSLSGFNKPLSGDIRFLGNSLVGKTPDEITRLGIVQVSEDRSLFRGLTVQENLQVASKNKRDVDQVLSYFPKLKAIMNRKASVLSGGEQQMLVIARALLLKPKVLVVDEMSLGLAPVVVESIFPIFREIVDRTGCSILMVEQHVHLALEIADRAYVMSRGRIVSEGPADEIASRLDELRGNYLGVS